MARREWKFLFSLVCVESKLLCERTERGERRRNRWRWSEDAEEKGRFPLRLFLVCLDTMIWMAAPLFLLSVHTFKRLHSLPLCFSHCVSHRNPHNMNPQKLIRQKPACVDNHSGSQIVGLLTCLLTSSLSSEWEYSLSFLSLFN